MLFRSRRCCSENHISKKKKKRKSNGRRAQVVNGQVVQQGKGRSRILRRLSMTHNKPNTNTDTNDTPTPANESPPKGKAQRRPSWSKLGLASSSGSRRSRFKASLQLSSRPEASDFGIYDGSKTSLESANSARSQFADFVYVGDSSDEEEDKAGTDY